MKNKGFIKLYRNVLTKPEMTDLVAEQGAAGLGVYIMVLLYLSQCDDFEGAFTNGQLSAFAAQARKPRSYVRQIICGYRLFLYFLFLYLFLYLHQRTYLYAQVSFAVYFHSGLNYYSFLKQS